MAYLPTKYGRLQASENLRWKNPYPTTRYAQPELDGLLDILRNSNISGSDVSLVTVESAMFEITGVDARKAPKYPEEARVSTYYWCAVVLLTGRAWLQGYEPELFDSP